MGLILNDELGYPPPTIPDWYIRRRRMRRGCEGEQGGGGEEGFNYNIVVSYQRRRIGWERGAVGTGIGIWISQR